MKLILAVFAAFLIQGCSKEAGADQTDHHDHSCDCKPAKLSAVKKFPVRPGVSPSCPDGQEYVLYQGHFSEKDGSSNAWCRKLEAGVCDCK